MSARVYLFALMPGSERPCVVKWWPKVVNDEWHGGPRKTPDSPRTLAEAGFRCAPGSKPSGVLCSEYPRWLVECESAEHGRRVIARRVEWQRIHGDASIPESDTVEACDCGQPDARPGDLTTSHLERCASYGRILASGGAA